MQQTNSHRGFTGGCVEEGFFCALNCFEAAGNRRVCSYLQHKSVPQRLKPVSSDAFYGTAKPVPFVQRGFSLSMFSPCAPDEHFVQNAP
jgi:hypothetical protein